MRQNSVTFLENNYYFFFNRFKKLIYKNKKIEKGNSKNGFLVGNISFPVQKSRRIFYIKNNLKIEH